MSEKLVIFVPEERAEMNCNIIRVDKEASEILRKLCAETGLAAKDLASRMLKYAAENLQIKFGGEE